MNTTTRQSFDDMDPAQQAKMKFRIMRTEFDVTLV